MTESISASSNRADESLKAQRRKAAKPMLWISIAGMAMMFAGLTSGYVVSRTALIEEGKWMEFALPGIFWGSTFLVLSISILLHFAVKNIRKDHASAASSFLLVALILSLLFVVFQYLGYRQLYESGVYFTGPGSSTAGSWIYVITFFHLLHLAAGIIALSVTFIKAGTGKYSAENTLGVELCATYWHFVDVLWIYLFIFLSLIR